MTVKWCCIAAQSTHSRSTYTQHSAMVKLAFYDTSIQQWMKKKKNLQWNCIRKDDIPYDDAIECVLCVSAKINSIFWHTITLDGAAWHCRSANISMGHDKGLLSFPGDLNFEIFVRIADLLRCQLQFCFIHCHFGVAKNNGMKYGLNAIQREEQCMSLEMLWKKISVCTNALSTIKAVNESIHYNTIVRVIFPFRLSLSLSPLRLS